MEIFQTARTIVREFTAADASDFFAHCGSQEVMRYIRPAKSREESDAFLQENLQLYKQLPGQGRWAVYLKEDGSFAGSFAIIPLPDKTGTQLGYALMPAVWGKGLATELSKAGLLYAASLQLEKIYGITHPDNIASQQVLLKAGFVQDGFVEHEGGRDWKSVYYF